MTDLNPSMRLKVKGDTFFLPDPEGGVYFRNNIGSFHMEGRTIDQWIEKLIPVFNGEHTLQELTDGLPEQYRDRVYEIAESLYRNGFVWDVSQDRPHQLAEEVLKKYDSQIAFLDNFGGSGAYHFQSYRQANVLAIGSGPFFVSMVAALLESGLPKFHMLVTDSVSTNRERLVELTAHARKADPEVEVQEISLQGERVSWREAVQPFDFILYVSQEGHVDELKSLQAVCREEKKVLLPAVCLQQAGLAGPLVHPELEACWESALRRIHRSELNKDPQVHTFSSTSGALLANLIVFELIKTVTGVIESELKNNIFLLNLETLEGEWHSFMPHPLVSGLAAAELIQDLELRYEINLVNSKSNGLFPYFSQLTSAKTGIFHVWDEADLQQLPLSQCRVQPVDPLSEGPAELLQAIICTGLTHEEARREAGLCGIEAYVSRMAGVWCSAMQPGESIGVGTGETVAEGVCRGLHKWLTDELYKQQADQTPLIIPVHLSEVEDDRCRFYLQALTTMQGAPTVGLGEEVSGFPVVWVGTSDGWYGSSGLNVTMALRKALQQALLQAQNKTGVVTTQTLQVSSVHLVEEVPQSLVIPAYQAADHSEVLHSAMQILKRNRNQLLVYNLAVEPFLKEGLAGVFGVLLREEETR